MAATDDERLSIPPSRRRRRDILLGGRAREGAQLGAVSAAATRHAPALQFSDLLRGEVQCVGVEPGISRALVVVGQEVRDRPTGRPTTVLERQKPRIHGALGSTAMGRMFEP